MIDQHRIKLPGDARIKINEREIFPRDARGLLCEDASFGYALPSGRQVFPERRDLDCGSSPAG